MFYALTMIIHMSVHFPVQISFSVSWSEDVSASSCADPLLTWTMCSAFSVFWVFNKRVILKWDGDILSHSDVLSGPLYWGVSNTQALAGWLLLRLTTLTGCTGTQLSFKRKKYHCLNKSNANEFGCSVIPRKLAQCQWGTRYQMCIHKQKIKYKSYS